jgi:hypothetical protein
MGSEGVNWVQCLSIINMVMKLLFSLNPSNVITSLMAISVSGRTLSNPGEQNNWNENTGNTLTYTYVNYLNTSAVRGISYVLTTSWNCWCQWPRGLKRSSAAAELLGLRVRIPSKHGCLSVVSAVCYQVEFSATGRSLVQRSPTECVCH